MRGSKTGFNLLDIPGGKADRWGPQSRKSKYEIPTLGEVGMDASYRGFVNTTSSGEIDVMDEINAKMRPELSLGPRCFTIPGMKNCGGIALMVCAGLLMGQPAGPSFEVATVRPSSPDQTIGQQIAQGRLHVGMSINQNRVEIAYLTLADMIPIAYRVKPNQIAGPDWMKNDRWDILAKLPDSASQNQAPEMLRSLLIERFGLQTHKETREQNVYVVSVTKEGPKLRRAIAGSSALALDANKSTEVVSAQQGKLERSPDGKTMTLSGGPAGVMRMTMPDPETTKIELRVSIATLTDLLNLDKPVVDQTELKDVYEVSLALPNDAAKGLMRAAMGLGSMGGPQDVTDAAAIAQALQKVGLKLESRKVPVEVIVVDRLERKPTDN